MLIARGILIPGTLAIAHRPRKKSMYITFTDAAFLFVHLYLLIL